MPFCSSRIRNSATKAVPAPCCCLRVADPDPTGYYALIDQPYREEPSEKGFHVEAIHSIPSIFSLSRASGRGSGHVQHGHVSFHPPPISAFAPCSISLSPRQLLRHPSILQHETRPVAFASHVDPPRPLTVRPWRVYVAYRYVYPRRIERLVLDPCLRRLLHPARLQVYTRPACP